MQYTKLFMGKDIVNPLWVELSTVCFTCYQQFGCKVTFDIEGRKNLNIKFLLLDCPRIELCLRFLELEMNSMKRLQKLNVEIDWDFTVYDYKSEVLSIAEVEDTLNFIDNYRENDIKEYLPKVFN